MEKIITYETLRNFTYSNDHLIDGDIKGIVLYFRGLNSYTMINEDFDGAVEYAKLGVIQLVPYFDPWCWMNRRTVKFVDEIIEVLCEKYNLGTGVKVVTTGDSMGALCSLVYCAYARITPCACLANCPVCDLPYHYTERPDLPRTLYSAFGEYEGTIEDALRTASPLHLADKMPDIPYTVFHCDNDKAVNIEKHSMKFVEAMKPSHNITLNVVADRGHCDLDDKARTEYRKTILAALA